MPGLSQLQQLGNDLAESKKLCQILLDRQVAFEERVISHLNTVQCYLQDLIVLAPTPFSPLATDSTPTTPMVQHEKQAEDGFTYPEVNEPLKPTQPAMISSSPLPPITTQDNFSGCKHNLDPSKLSYIRAQSCSRENFSSKLVKELFTMEERSKSNVKGIMGKKKLDQQRIAYVQAVTFENYPCPLSEQKAAWSKCIKAIDTANRAICRAVKTVKENIEPE